MKTTAPVTATLAGLEVMVRQAGVYSDPPQVLRSSGREGDPAWRFTDAAGHQHTPDVYTDDSGTDRVRSWPTLQTVVDETYWCEDCHDEHDRTHLECALCHEAIVPGSRAARDVVIPSPLMFRATLAVGQESLTTAKNPPLWGRDEVELQIGEETYRGVITSTTYEWNELVTWTFEGRQV